MKTKTNLTVSVDAESLEKFKILAESAGISLSKFVNSKIKEVVREAEKNGISSSNREKD